MSARVRWKSARFVPLTVVEALLSGEKLNANQWSVDGASGCLVPNGKGGPFRTGVRWNAAVDRLSGASERHATACIEFRPGSGLWTIVGFADDAARDRWQEPVKAAFRLLADTGFGGERSRGWGRADAPEFIEGSLPELIIQERTKAAAESSPVPPLQEPPVEPSPVPPIEEPPVENPPEQEPPAELPPPDPEPPAFPEPEPLPAMEAEVRATESIVEMRAEEDGSHRDTEAQSLTEETDESQQVPAAVSQELAAAEEEISRRDAENAEKSAEKTEEAVEAVPEPADEEHELAALAAGRPSGPPLQAHWLLSLFTPAAADAVDWARGSYTVLARGGRVDSPSGSGELKKQIQMVAEGSVLYADGVPRGAAADVAPDGFAHPVFRAGFALSIRLPEVH
jgi:hypothetical protein